MSWLANYHAKRHTADEAVAAIQDNDTVYIQPGCAEPEQLVGAMVRRGRELHGVKVIHLLTAGTADYVAPEMAGHFRHVAFFAGANVRSAINEGRADFIPIFLSEMEVLFVNNSVPVDVSLIHVSPPDEHGFCSYGVGVDTTKTATEHARIVIAQVNPKMPYVQGDSLLDVYDLDILVPVEAGARYHIMVRSYDGSGNFDLKVEPST